MNSTLQKNVIEKKPQTDPLKKPTGGIGKSLAMRADRVADIILDPNPQVKGAKAKLIKHETVSLLRDVKEGVVTNFQNVKPRHIFREAAFAIGRLSTRVKQTLYALSDFFNQP
jgi:hypothetical protein